MDITISKIYRDEDTGTELRFIPVPNAPGFSHKVIIEGKPTGMWLSSEKKPSFLTAEYFLTKHYKESN